MMLINLLTHYQGSFEYHITVTINHKNSLERFQQFCQQHQVKPIIIQLITGDTPIQPMLSKRTTNTPLFIVQEIKGLIADLKEEAFIIGRLKIEAGIKNNNIPQQDIEAQGLAEQFYFEHHVKLQLPKDYPIQVLRKNMQAYHGHVSANVFWKDEDYQYQFVTQRFRNMGLYSAWDALKALLQYLEQEKIIFVKVIREYNIYDSNIDLDQGWLA